MNKKIIIYLLLILQICCINIANAQEEIEVIRLDKVIDIAIENNSLIALKQSLFKSGKSEILLKNERSNPSLIFDGGTAEKTYRLGIQQIFETAGKRKKRIALANSQNAVLENEINTELLNLRKKVRDSYIYLYNAQEKYRAANEILEMIEELSKILEKRQAEKALVDVGVIQLKIVKLNAKNDLQSAKILIDNALNNLNMLSGLSLSSWTKLATPDIDRKFEELYELNKESDPAILGVLLQKAYENRPELEKVFNEIEVADKEIDLAKANRIPDILLITGPDMVYAFNEFGQNVFNYGVFTFLDVEIPVFDRKQSEIKSALSRKCRLKSEISMVQKKIELEIKNAYLNVINSKETIDIYEKELLPEARNVVEMAKQNFLKGKSSVLVPIEAQQVYTDTRFNYIQALINYNSAISSLERAIGTGI